MEVTVRFAYVNLMSCAAITTYLVQCAGFCVYYPRSRMNSSKEAITMQDLQIDAGVTRENGLHGVGLQPMGGGVSG